MSGTEQVYLRDRRGAAFGPLEATALEVLYCADIVDDQTPVSTDGRSFIPLGRSPELCRRAQAARDRLAEGANPWDTSPLNPAEDLLDDEGELAAAEASEVPTEPPPPPTPSPSPAPRAAPTAARASAPGSAPPTPPRPPPPPVTRPSVPPPARASAPPPAPAPAKGPERLDGRGLPLSAHPAAKLLFDHAIEGSTGRLRFSTDFGDIDCRFLEGTIVSIETDMDLLALDQFLVNKGALTPEALARARRKLPGAELGHALISLGLIPPHVYMDALGRWARTTLSWIVALEDGRAEFEAEVFEAPQVPIGLERFASLVQAVREGVQRDQINAIFAAHRDAPLIPSQLSGVELDQLKLDPRELRVLRGVDGARTVGAMMETLKGSEAALLGQRALFIGYVSRFLVLGEPRGKTGAHAIPAADTTREPPPREPPPREAPAPRATAPKSPLTPPRPAARSPLTPPSAASAGDSPAPEPAVPAKPAAPAPKPPSPANDALEALRLQKELEAWQSQDPFRVLGASASSSDPEVRQKFMTLAKKYHPDAAPPGTADEVLAVRQEIFAFLQHMYDQIKTEALRAEFKLLVDEGLKNREEEQELVRAILDAENCFLKAEAMVKSRRWKEALAELDEGLRLKRNDKEMQVYKAYVEAMLDGAYPRAIKRINELMSKDDNLLSGFLFLARLLKAAGDQDGAIKMYKRVQQLDPHNNEAASEIRLTNMRKEKEKKKGKWF